MRTLIIFLLLFYPVAPVFAADPPILTSPSNNSTVASSTLNWQAPLYPVCSNYDAYRVQVDNDPSFPSSSIYRNIYTKNTYYTPQLTLGTWYWRVMVRDETCNNWSSWSTVWSFILATSTPSPTPTPSSTPTSSSSTSSNSSSSSASTFTISNTPSQINSDQSSNVSVNLALPDNPNTSFYLKGAFKKSDGSNYFGLTKVSGSWIKNGSTYSNQYPVKTNSSGNWSGNLEIQPDADDSGFTGSDDYIFKVGRYTSSGSGPTWSNETTIKIVAASTNQGATTETSSKTSDSPTVTSPPQTAKAIPANSSSKNSGNVEYHIASVAAVSSGSATPSTVEVKSEKRPNFLPFIGGVLILAGLGSLGYIYLRSKKII
ncbi:MAG: weak similarity to S [Microgenomates group bacterium Gr01-1014_7]|nr:MAG: weak similarity to S [Microgenomates group bacterium Gr01-1014_7]